VVGGVMFVPTVSMHAPGQTAVVGGVMFVPLICYKSCELSTRLLDANWH